MRAVALVLLLAACAVCGTARAEIEKFADASCKQGLCLYWWPRLPPLEGWHQEQEAGRRNASNILAPTGYNFTTAETIMYARATFKNRMPEAKSLEAFIAKDKADTLQALPGTIAADAPALRNGDGKTLRTLTYYPAPSVRGSWERLAYDEEGDFYLILAISSHSRKGLDDSMKEFEHLIAAYKAHP